MVIDPSLTNSNSSSLNLSMYFNFLPATASIAAAMPNSSGRSAIASGSSDGKTRSERPKVSKDLGCRSISWNSRLPSPVRKPSSPAPKPSPSEGKPSSSVSKVPLSERKPCSPVRKPSSPARKSSSPVRKQYPPVTKSHSLILHSPKLLESKPSIESKTTLKPQSKPKDVELQAKLDATLEYLKKLEEKLVSVEEEKIKASKELNEAKRRINETTEKLQLAIIAKQKAEESLETEKFVVDELVQAGIANAEAYQKEFKSIQEQHSLDASALLVFTKELHKLKVELFNAINEKNNALKEADDAENIAQLNVEKVNALFTEVGHLKSLLDSDLDMHKEAIDTIKKLNDENNALKHGLGRAKLLEERLPKMEALAEKLQMEVSDMKKVESDASKQVEELKKEVALLEASMKEANQSKNSAVEILAIIRKKMEEETSSVQDAETEIAALTRKIASLENELVEYKPDIEETDRDRYLTQQEVLCLEKTIELLKSELEKLEEEKFLLDNKVASADADLHLEEKNRHNHELENSREDGEKARTAKESLASALHEISSMSTDNEQRLLAKQAEIEAVQIKIERFNSDVRNTKDVYELMLDYIKYEILCLKKAIERFEAASSNSRSECDTKELYFVNNVERSEYELAYLKVEMAMDLNKLAEKEVHMLKDDRVDVVSKLRQAFDAAEEATGTLQLEKKLSGKGTVLQCDTQDEELWTKQSSFLYLPNYQTCYKNDQEPTEDEDEDQRINEDGGCSMYAMSNVLVGEKDQEAELTDDYVALKTSVDNSGSTFVMTQSQLHQKKKKDFLRRFGNFLKKKKGVDIVHK